MRCGDGSVKLTPCSGCVEVKIPGIEALRSLPALGLEGGQVWVQGALLWIQVPAVAPTVFRRAQGSLGALLHGQEGASKTQIPRHHPDLLMWAEPRRLHVDDLLLGESGTHFLWVMPVRPCQDSYLAPEHSGSWWGACPAHGWLQMGWASGFSCTACTESSSSRGDSCAHCQDAVNSNSRPASSFLWIENVFPVGEGRGQKILSGPQLGHLLFTVCIPGSVW